MKHLSYVTLVIILSLVLFSSCQQIENLFGKKKKAEAAALAIQQQAMRDSIRVADSLKRAQDALLAREMVRQDSIRLVEEARLASKYHIIVGSFYTTEYARSWSEEFKSKGYNVQILQMRGSRFELVSAESFSDLRSAFNKLPDYQLNVMPEAWVYVNE